MGVSYLCFGASEGGGGGVSDGVRGNKSKLSENLTVVAFSVPWCSDLSWPVPLLLGRFWFISRQHKRIEEGFSTRVSKVLHHCIITGCKAYKQPGYSL